MVFLMLGMGLPLKKWYCWRGAFKGAAERDKFGFVEAAFSDPLLGQQEHRLNPRTD